MSSRASRSIIFFVMFGECSTLLPVTTDMLRDADADTKLAISHVAGPWRRGSTDWKRSRPPEWFYPVFIDLEAHARSSTVGDASRSGSQRRRATRRPGQLRCWPLDPTGEEGRWQISPERLREQLAEGTRSVGRLMTAARDQSVIYLIWRDRAADRSGAIPGGWSRR